MYILIVQQVTRPAIERDEEDRAQYQFIIGSHYEPEQLVFVDESAFDRRVKVFGEVMVLIVCRWAISRWCDLWTIAPGHTLLVRTPILTKHEPCKVCNVAPWIVSKRIEVFRMIPRPVSHLKNEGTMLAQVANGKQRAS